MPKNHINITTTLVTFSVFTAEALLHYNLGARKDPNETRKFVFPPPKDFVKLAGIVLVFSVISGVITAKLQK